MGRDSQPGAVSVQVFANKDELCAAAAAALTSLAAAAVQQRGRFDLVLAGGSTPRDLYERLASDYADRNPWPAVRLFWGDERCVPPDHPQSNYRLAWETLISRVPIPADHLFRMPGDVESPPVGAAQYEQTLRRVLDTGRNQFPRFDLVLLGLGEDGHTASLFTGSPVLRTRRRWVIDVVAPPTYTISNRLTLTAPVLNHARAVFYLVTGANKSTAVQAALAAQPSRSLPTSRIQRPAITWFLDSPANPQSKIQNPKPRI
jgi:6-phosphogluconolactonase